jgi:hypothetical protein
VDISRLPPGPPDMPPSDNLYSAGDSDGESFSEELTPTDGYFHRGEISPSTMVNDPQTQDDKKPEPKMLIPIPNARGTPRPSTAANHPALAQPAPSASSAGILRDGNSTSTPSHTQSRVPQNPLEQYTEPQQATMSGPPPAYTPNPTNPLETPTSSRYMPSNASSRPPQEPQSPRRYSTFAEQPHLERGFLFPPRQPESMGEVTEDDSDERTPLTVGGEGNGRTYRRTVLKRIFLCGVVFTALIGLLVTLLRSKTNVSFWTLYTPIRFSGADIKLLESTTSRQTNKRAAAR